MTPRLNTTLVAAGLLINQGSKGDNRPRQVQLHMYKQEVGRVLI
jgi:hypothetical protein